MRITLAGEVTASISLGVAVLGLRRRGGGRRARRARPSLARVGAVLSSLIGSVSPRTAVVRAIAESLRCHRRGAHDGADASNGTSTSALGERAVAADQLERSGVVGIEEAHRVTGDERDVAETGDARAAPPSAPNQPSSTCLLPGDHPRDVAVPGRSPPGRSSLAAPRDRVPPPEASLARLQRDHVEQVRIGLDDPVADLDLAVVGGDEQRRRRARARRGCRRRCGRRRAARRRRSRRSRARGRSCRRRRSRRTRSARRRAAGGRPPRRSPTWPGSRRAVTRAGGPR